MSLIKMNLVCVRLMQIIFSADSRRNAFGVFIVCSLLTVTSAATTSSNPATTSNLGIVLVPGYFNSLAAGHARVSPENGTIDVAPYFSESILETFEARGLPTVVVDNLDPAGSIESNGELLLEFMHHLRANPRWQKCNWVLVAHSAGGLYSLYALTREPSLPVSSLITLATPFRGVELVERLGDDAPILNQIVSAIGLGTVLGLKPHPVDEFLSSVRVPPKVRVFAGVGVQKACTFLNCLGSDSLSWILTLAQSVLSEPSDGIITQSSALGSNVHLTSTLGQTVEIEKPKSLFVDLEHWKQVQDYRLFLLLGTLDVHAIDVKQRRFFSRVADLVLDQAATSHADTNTAQAKRTFRTRF